MREGKVLCVHPNYELYGSDRWFADALLALERVLGADSLRVLLPRPGPIETLPPFGRVKVRHRPMLVLRRKGFLRRALGALIAAPWLMWRAWRDMDGAQGTYVNTIIAVDFLLMARFARRPVVIHVHEIPPPRERWIFRALLVLAGRKVIFNSEASRRAFALPLGIETAVVHNGFRDPGPPVRLPLAGRKLRLLVIGRINRWKGQDVLVEACSLLPVGLRDALEVRIVGDAFTGNDDLREQLADRVAAAGLSGVIQMHPFADDPGEYYRHADVVVVPSSLPEPFGRVAVEAMAHGCCVVASAHGGLAEIVVDGVTGVLFPPRDAAALAGVIADLAAHPHKVVRLGQNGRERFLDQFTQERIDQQFLRAVLPLRLTSGALVLEPVG